MTQVLEKVSKESASFRDPDGFVFYQDGSIYRTIVPERAEFVKSLLDNKVLQGLIKDKKLVNTWQAENFVSEDPKLQDNLILEHEKIDYIGYPHEWSTSQLLDAAIFTLEMQETLLEENLALKDATPYNVQFIDNKPVLIDFSSIEENNNRRIWLAYNQFQECFLYPIILKIERNINNKKTFIVNFNGIKVEETKQLLGSGKSFSPSYLLDVGLPYLFRKKDDQAKSMLVSELKITEDQKRVNLATQKFALRSLKSKVLGLKKKFIKQQKKTIWADYTANIHYGDKDYQNKKTIITSILQKLSSKKVIDLGSNTGDFSLIAEANGAKVMSIDLDHDCIDTLYNRALEQKLNITTVWSELDNPSPAIGWRNRERKSLLDRVSDGFKADTVMALALMHHLLISSRIPLDEIVDFMASLTHKHLVIEYVGPEDMMFIKTLGTRDNIYTHINEEYFRKVVETKFNVVDIHELDNKRKIYVLEKQ